MTLLNTDNYTLFTQAMHSNPSVSLSAKDLKKAEKTAEDFEAFFLTKMMETLFDGISTEGFFGGGHAEKIYRSMLLDQYGKEMAKVGSVGVKDSVMRSIIEMQEIASNGYIQG
ncbi:MAG: rod-binding protein [Alphaproteobacteria bacterium]|nr:rod-binding protein [Alphaproteobacteria bacterium]